jgi:hypothetical protein
MKERLPLWFLAIFQSLSQVVSLIFKHVQYVGVSGGALGRNSNTHFLKPRQFGSMNEPW